jgi:hypothetical protein
MQEGKKVETGPAATTRVVVTDAAADAGAAAADAVADVDAVGEKLALLPILVADPPY